MSRGSAPLLGPTMPRSSSSSSRRAARQPCLLDDGAATVRPLGTPDDFLRLLDVAGYCDAFLAQVESAGASGLMRTAHRQLILDATEPDALLERLRNFRPATASSKWAEPVRR